MRFKWGEVEKLWEAIIAVWVMFRAKTQSCDFEFAQVCVLVHKLRNSLYSGC
jgi:hypothetical protein